MTHPNYPLKFEPIYIEKLWGGNKLNSLLNKKSPYEKTGESWEISTVNGSESVVVNGELKGKSLQELVNENPTSLMGERVVQQFGGAFPLLIKFIDAAIPLSVQVHPNDEMAAEYDSFGKNEMWYILDSGTDATIYLGFNENETQENIKKALAQNSIMDNIKSYSPQPSDVFYVKAGTVHSIGQNVLLAEIQQTSNITFRLYDFNRPDKDGNLRELHINEGLRALNYQTTENAYLSAKNRTEAELVHNQYFKVNQYQIKSSFTSHLRDYNSFVIYMCLEGELEVKTHQGNATIKKGETVLLPFAAGEFSLSGNAEILEVYV